MTCGLHQGVYQDFVKTIFNRVVRLQAPCNKQPYSQHTIGLKQKKIHTFQVKDAQVQF